MKFSKWHIAPAEEADIRRLGEAGYPQLVSQVLAARGISTAEEAAAFLERGRDLTCSPFLMKDMDRAVERISRAMQSGSPHGGVRGLRRGRHHRHGDPGDRLPEKPGRRCAALYPSPHRGRLRAGAGRHPLPP